jgi:hypothetical protein
MQQSFLDPSNIDRDTCKSWVPHTLHADVRKFGFYPDVSLLKPGDLILVRNLEGNISHKVIEAVQKNLGYHERDYRCHHAAVYLGIEGKICEADIDGVRYASIDRYSTGCHYIRVRRPLGLSEDQRWQIAVKSLIELKKGYSFWHLWELFKLSRFKIGRIPTTRLKPPESTKICSQLYADAFAKVTLELLSSGDNGEVTPASLSRTQKLEDVPIEWVRIG